jgi:phosphoribosylformylglycinamidine cyclo-ligase
MPGFYSASEYDLAGFIVGVVDREKVIDGKQIVPGDVLLALPSVGLHTNGYSLARKLFFEVAGYEVNTYVEELSSTVREALLQPHLSYLRPLAELIDKRLIKGLAHITGGGLSDNIPRILPSGTAVLIEKGTWPILPIFELLQRIGSVSESEMFRTFNMGVGMVIVCAAGAVSEIKEHLSALGEKCYEIGKVKRGKHEVAFE